MNHLKYSSDQTQLDKLNYCLKFANKQIKLIGLHPFFSLAGQTIISSDQFPKTTNLCNKLLVTNDFEGLKTSLESV